jgi:pyruvate/2-oxoglutarate dehydrogenase complex dihydrolipoamide acyltransferase (E2) component
MPAMSPTMTEGSIAEWKKKVGESFTAGDVLLEIETDKATIDVEAQDDGIMGKILTPDGSKNIPVGKVIALLAEIGDDISNLPAPKKEPVLPKEEQLEAPSPPPSLEPSTSGTSVTPTTDVQSSSHSKHPQHSRPLFPSVYRLLVENMITNPEVIEGTGVRGMLTKGDILAYLGKASGPTGTYKKAEKEAKVEKKDEYRLLDGPAVRRLIVTTLQRPIRARNVAPPRAPDFDEVITDYLLPQHSSSVSKILSPSPKTKNSTANYFDGLI